MGHRDFFIALTVILFWSINLVIQKVFCQKISLEFFNLIRFFCCIPLIFFVKKPSIEIFKLIILALFWNVFSFFLIGLSLQAGTGVGTISVVYQTCSFFGIFFCYLIIKEIPKINQIAGMILAFLGILLLFNDSISHRTSTLGLFYILLAAMSWGLGVTLFKKFKLRSDLSMNVWLASLSFVPMTGIAYLKGGIPLLQESFHALSVEIMLGILFASYGATLLAGYIWFYLLKKYPSSLITPFMLLLPPFSCIMSYIFLSERFTLLQILGFLVIFLGIIINQNIIRLILWKKSAPVH